MAPRGKRGGDGEAAEPQAFHELGVRGRKTGTFLRDTGERDEHGMQPINAIFSSPHERGSNGNDESGSEDMDISYSVDGPGPRTLLKNQRSTQNPSLERSSPDRNSNDDSAVSRKLDFSGRGSGGASSKSKANGKAKGAGLNGNGALPSDELEDLETALGGGDDDDMDLDDMVEPPRKGTAGLGSKSVTKAGAKLGSKRSVQKTTQKAVEEDVEEEEREEEMEEVSGVEARKGRNRSKAALKEAPKTTQKATKKISEKPVPKPGPKPGRKAISKPSKAPSPSPEPDKPDEAELDEEEEEEQEEEQEQAQEVEEEAEEQVEERQPVKGKRGRPAKVDAPPEKPSRKRRSTGGGSTTETSAQAEVEDEAPRKKQRTSNPGPASNPGPSKVSKSKSKSMDKPPAVALPSAPAAKTTAGRGRPGRKPKSAAGSGMETKAGKGDGGDTSFQGLQRGPPMPKARGLVSMRKDSAMTQTRSGRHSYKPVDYWRGEQVILEEEEQDDIFNRKGGFVLPKIKEVVRVPLEAPPPRTTAGSRGRVRPKGKKAAPPPEEEEVEEWEVEPGIVEGEIVIWEAEHEEHPPADDEAVQVTDERIAISARAIQTSDIRDATFRFAKTLTMPFIGAGVVDLPPGGEKRPKNSRKMHMVFFVHYGKVMVTINEAQFRISAGGMWFVPRGNYYSITNDYDNPSRVFFCQACEISTPSMDSTQMTMG